MSQTGFTNLLHLPTQTSTSATNLVEVGAIFDQISFIIIISKYFTSGPEVKSGGFFGVV
jgi:hypothetical protein